MDMRIAPGPNRLDVSSTPSAPRVTPPSGDVPFREVVTRGSSALMRGAEAAVMTLPGAPIVAAAVRPGGGTPSASPLGRAPAPAGTGNVAAPVPSAGAAEGPYQAASASGAGVEQTLAQSQEFNLYYLQLQEQLSAENRAYTAMSNVLKARHDTVKNAIGNIR